jgi:hypothetical protein
MPVEWLSSAITPDANLKDGVGEPAECLDIQMVRICCKGNAGRAVLPPECFPHRHWVPAVSRVDPSLRRIAANSVGNSQTPAIGRPKHVYPAPEGTERPHRTRGKILDKQSVLCGDSCLWLQPYGSTSTLRISYLGPVARKANACRRCVSPDSRQEYSSCK